MTEIEKEYGPLDSKGNSREQSGVFAPSESGEEEQSESLEDGSCHEQNR